MIKKNKPDTSYLLTGKDNCSPTDCGQMFGAIGEGLKDLKSEMHETRKDISELNTRIAGQEAKTTSAFHGIDRVDKRVSELPEAITNAIQRHEDGCNGRKYVWHKLTKTNSTVPYPSPAVANKLYSEKNDDTELFHRQKILLEMAGEKRGGMEIPKPVLYIGLIIGIAIAASGYFLSLWGVI